LSDRAWSVLLKSFAESNATTYGIDTMELTKNVKTDTFDTFCCFYRYRDREQKWRKKNILMLANH
jgi:hypothetical protein